MNIPLIGIGGRLRAGKDTVADYLVDTYGFTKLGMSDPLARALYTLNPLIPINTRDSVDGVGISGQFVRYAELVDRVGYVQAKTNPEVRELLQRLGTDVGRKMIDEDVWTSMMLEDANDILDAFGRVVVTGIRFLNELDAIADARGVSWWVSRPIPTKQTDFAAIVAHESERGVNEADFEKVIRNEGSLHELHVTVDLMMAATMPDVSPVRQTALEESQAQATAA